MVSDIIWKERREEARAVLILVLMEYGLWLSSELIRFSACNTVLILVLMEYGLWHMAVNLAMLEFAES